MVSHPINTSKLWLALGAYVEANAPAAIFYSNDRGDTLKDISPPHWNVMLAGGCFLVV
jgi:hypothetical protein